MKPEARQFHRAAMMGLEHARQHALVDSELDGAQVILSLDYALEMLLKAVLLNRGQTIMSQPGRSIDLQEAMKKCGQYKQGTAVEILHVRRNSLQHFAAYTDAATTQDLYEGAVLLVEEILDAEFNDVLPPEFRIRRPMHEGETTGLELVAPAEELQRDVHASGVTVVWAQAVAGQSTLAVHVKIGAADSSRLTALDGYEYHPRTDGVHVAAYRQSGGVVLYQLRDGSNRLISESGGPGAVRGRYVAAQGIGVLGGLGGGVWLYDIERDRWRQLSDGGDSPRLTEEHVLWQEFVDGEHRIVAQSVEGGRTMTVVGNGMHPSASGRFIAWTDPGAEPAVHVSDMAGHEMFWTTPGIFPDIDGDHVAYLRPHNDRHDLVVVDIKSGAPLVDEADVGFPMGSGPILSLDWVYFESRLRTPLHAILRTSWRL